MWTVSSNLTLSAILGRIIYWDVAKPVRHRTLTPACSGSNPDVPAIFSGGVVSKLVKEMVCNTISAGSNPVNSSKILLL